LATCLDEGIAVGRFAVFSGLKNETRLMGLLVRVLRGPVPGVSADESVGLLAEEVDVDLVPDFAGETEEQGVVGVVLSSASTIRACMLGWSRVLRTLGRSALWTPCSSLHRVSRSLRRGNLVT
jgi:hypothetical protein